MGKTFEKDVHQTSADTSTPGSVEHADADQFEVSSQPRVGDVRCQHLDRAIRPPLAMLTRVAVGEADQHFSVVRAGEAKAGSDAVLVQTAARHVS